MYPQIQRPMGPRRPNARQPVPGGWRLGTLSRPQTRDGMALQAKCSQPGWEQRRGWEHASMLILLFCSQRSNLFLIYTWARALVSLRIALGMGTVGNGQSVRSLLGVVKDDDPATSHRAARTGQIGMRRAHLGGR